MPILNIEALDTLFFRDGRPFSMGEDNYADNVIFPPMPSVFYGAIASSYISNELQRNIALSKAVKNSEQLVIRGVALLIENVCYFPLPKDLLCYKGNTEKVAKLSLQAIPNNGTIDTSSYGLSHILQKSKKDNIHKIDNSPRIISQDLLEDCLHNKMEERYCATQLLKDIYCAEPKIGIGRDNSTRTVKNGLLYRANMVRMSNETYKASFVVEQNLLAQSAILQLGGEKKVAAADIMDIASLAIEFPEIQDDEIFKIYLATPAIFKAGWRPDEFLNKYNLELIAAATDKPIHVGGWDLDKKCPKPMRLAVPAGSVYYVQAQKGKENKVAEAIQFIKENKSISELNTAKQGFGLAFVGKK